MTDYDEHGNVVKRFDGPALARERDTLKAECERLRGALSKVAKAVPEIMVNRTRYICLCGAGASQPHDIDHYAHCVVMLARAALADPPKGDG